VKSFFKHDPKSVDERMQQKTEELNESLGQHLQSVQHRWAGAPHLPKDKLEKASTVLKEKWLQLPPSQIKEMIKVGKVGEEESLERRAREHFVREQEEAVRNALSHQIDSLLSNGSQLAEANGSRENSLYCSMTSSGDDTNSSMDEFGSFFSKPGDSRVRPNQRRGPRPSTLQKDGGPLESGTDEDDDSAFFWDDETAPKDGGTRWVNCPYFSYCTCSHCTGISY
jgi:hypothetical protein